MQLYLGDCLDVLPTLPDKSVDMILCDLPYGTTQNKWDSVINLATLWGHYRRLCKGAIVLTAAQPFTSSLVMSNLSMFKYQWVWNKSKVTGVLNAKIQPLRNHEDVLVFYDRQPIYNPQGVSLCDKRSATGVGVTGSSKNYGKVSQTEDGTYRQTVTGYPRTVLQIPSEGKTVHPTQKPVALMEYLIRTYTNPGDVVLDNCAGSGSTGVAALQSGRQFIGIERELEYWLIAHARLSAIDSLVTTDVPS